MDKEDGGVRREGSPAVRVTANRPISPITRCPLIPDIELSAVERRGGFGFGWIFIPAQPEYARRILVRGALADGRVVGTHVSVPFRVGEDTG
jgi:hypothetical protein